MLTARFSSIQTVFTGDSPWICDRRWTENVYDNRKLSRFHKHRVREKERRDIYIIPACTHINWRVYLLKILVNSSEKNNSPHTTRCRGIVLTYREVQSQWRRYIYFIIYKYILKLYQPFPHSYEPFSTLLLLISCLQTCASGLKSHTYYTYRKIPR